MNPYILRRIGCLLLLWLGGVSTAAGECRIRYQYSITDEHRPMVETTLTEGESLHLAQSRLSFVENIGEHPVRLFITGVPASVLVLPGGARTPAQGEYDSPAVQLVNVTCPIRLDHAWQPADIPSPGGFR
jgi:hypothetical protein